MGFPSLTPKNRGLPSPPALDLFLAALDSGAWKLNFFTAWIRAQAEMAVGKTLEYKESEDTPVYTAPSSKEHVP